MCRTDQRFHLRSKTMILLLITGATLLSTVDSAYLQQLENRQFQLSPNFTRETNQIKNSTVEVPVSNLDEKCLKLFSDRIDVASFNVCTVHCKGKSCECCRNVSDLVCIKACVTTYMDPAEKTINLGLSFGSVLLFNKQINLQVGWLESACLPLTLSNFLKIEICFSAPMKENYPGSPTFTVCPRLYFTLNGEELPRTEPNCLEYKGDLVFDIPSYLGFMSVIEAARTALLVKGV